MMVRVRLWHDGRGGTGRGPEGFTAKIGELTLCLGLAVILAENVARSTRAHVAARSDARR